MDIAVNYQGVEFEAPTYVDLALEGVLGLPEIEPHDLSYSTRNGLSPGQDFTRGKVITFSGVINGTDPTTYGTDVESFRAAFQSDGTENNLFITVPGLAGGSQVSLACRPRAGSLKIDIDYDNMNAAFSVQLYATDPTFYAAFGNTAVYITDQTTITSTTGGHGFNHGFNLSFGGGTTALIILNYGSTISYPVITFFGPCVNPHIINQAAPGNGLSFDINLGVGDYLTVDTLLRQITLNGSSNRYDTINDSDWFGLYPGNNTITFTVASTTGSPAPIAQLVYRSAWL